MLLLNLVNLIYLFQYSNFKKVIILIFMYLLIYLLMYIICIIYLCQLILLTFWYTHCFLTYNLKTRLFYDNYCYLIVMHFLHFILQRNDDTEMNHVEDDQITLDSWKFKLCSFFTTGTTVEKKDNVKSGVILYYTVLHHNNTYNNTILHHAWNGCSVFVPVLLLMENFPVKINCSTTVLVVNIFCSKNWAK